MAKLLKPPTARANHPLVTILQNCWLVLKAPLASITELTVRLYGIPEAIAAGSCSFPTVDDACNTTILAMQSGIPMARIELMDADIVDCVNKYSNLDFPVAPLLLLEFHGTAQGVKETTNCIQRNS